MGSAPPPPPDLRYQRRVWAEQARLAQQQQRADWKRTRIQARGLRRRSIAGPLLIAVVGVVFLLVQLGKLSWAGVAHWYARWWPTLLIAAGVIALLEWLWDRQTVGTAIRPRPVGAAVALLVFGLLVLGIVTRTAPEWFLYNGHWSDGFQDLTRIFGERQTSEISLAAALRPSQTLLIRNGHGDLVITGTSTDGQVHVNATVATYAWRHDQVRKLDSEASPVFSEDGGNLLLRSGSAASSRTDLTITLPAAASVNIENDDGEVDLSGIQGAVAVSLNHGDLTLARVGGPIVAQLHDDDTSVSGRELGNSVDLEGHMGDVDLEQVSGSVTMRGDFFGSTQLTAIAGPLSFQSSRTNLQCQSIHGQLEIDGGPELDGSNLTGPVVLQTSNRNITLDTIRGMAQIRNRNGSVNLSMASPVANVDIQNQHGSIDLALPTGTSFTVNAQTHNGDIENDFALSPQGSKELRTLQGTVGQSGPRIILRTSDGDLVLRRTLLGEAGGGVSNAPQPPAAFQHVPKAPSAPKAPRPPRVPSADDQF